VKKKKPVLEENALHHWKVLENKALPKRVQADAPPEKKKKQ